MNFCSNYLLQPVHYIMSLPEGLHHELAGMHVHCLETFPIKSEHPL